MWVWLGEVLATIGRAIKALINIQDAIGKLGAPLVAGVIIVCILATFVHLVYAKYGATAWKVWKEEGSPIVLYGLGSISIIALLIFPLALLGSKNDETSEQKHAPRTTGVKRNGKIARLDQSPCAGHYCGIGGPDLDPFNDEDAAKLGPDDVAEARKTLGRTEGRFCAVRNTIKPFHFEVRLQRDGACQRWFDAANGVVDLFIKDRPVHGELTKYGRSWQYVASKGYRGPDRFSIMRCFRTGLNSSECLTLDYAVNVL